MLEELGSMIGVVTSAAEIGAGLFEGLCSQAVLASRRGKMEYNLVIGVIRTFLLRKGALILLSV